MIQVIKIGGNVVDNESLLQNFVHNFSRIDGQKILVHGGGVMASRLQKQMGMVPKMVEGRRITDEDTLKVVTMVYAGWCSKHITALLQREGCNAMGLSGCDGNLIYGEKRPVKTIDYGFAGDITPDSINTDLLLLLLNNDITPVINAITHDGKGLLLNTNADTIASTVAEALAQQTDTTLTYCFEKDGVLYNKDDAASVIPLITPSAYTTLKEEGRIADGMIPKLDNAFNALHHGVCSVNIKHANNVSNAIGTTLSL